MLILLFGAEQIVATTRAQAAKPAGAVLVLASTVLSLATRTAATAGSYAACWGFAEPFQIERFKKFL